MIQHRLILGYILILLFSSEWATCGAQQEESPSNIEIDQFIEEIGTATELIPKRELEFEVTEEAAQMKLFRADPKLLELRYVAVVDLAINATPSRVELPNDLRNLTYYYDRISLFHWGSRRSGRSSESPNNYFEQLVANITRDNELPEAKTAFLTSDDVETLVRFSMNEQWSYTFTILAPSETLAKDRAATLLHVIDYGIVAPIRRHLRSGLIACHEAMSVNEADLERLSGEILDLENRCDHLPDINLDELGRLKTQHRLLAVDFAGTEARIEAATKILARFRDLRVSNPRVEQVENVKVTAEIELAGLGARQKTLDKIIEEGKQRAKLMGQIAELKSKRQDTENSIRRLSKLLEYYKASFDVYAPLAPHEGKIVVQPIKWTD